MSGGTGAPHNAEVRSSDSGDKKSVAENFMIGPDRWPPGLCPTFAVVLVFLFIVAIVASILRAYVSADNLLLKVLLIGSKKLLLDPTRHPSSKEILISKRDNQSLILL